MCIKVFFAPDRYTESEIQRVLCSMKVEDDRFSWKIFLFENLKNSDRAKHNTIKVLDSLRVSSHG